MPQPLLSARSKSSGAGVKAARLEDFYDARDWASVKRHLQQDPNSALLLTEAQAPLKRLFGADARIALEVVQEPEGGEAERLFVRIHTGGDWQAAFDKMDRFDEEWWLDASATLASRLEFSIAYS